MRKIIAALVMSLDGFIEGPNEELDWIDTWDDPFDDMYPNIDACILGGKMYPGYEQYWRAILANPTGTLPFSGKVASQGEIDYAHCFIQCGGTLQNGETFEDLVRATFCLQKAAGAWKVTHQHGSKPLQSSGGK